MRTKRHRPKTSQHHGHSTRRSISIMFARRIFCWSTCDVFSFCLCALLIVTVVSITQSDRPKIVSFDEHQALLIRVGFKNTWLCDHILYFSRFLKSLKVKEPCSEKSPNSRDSFLVILT